MILFCTILLCLFVVKIDITWLLSPVPVVCYPFENFSVASIKLSVKVAKGSRTRFLSFSEMSYSNFICVRAMTRGNCQHIK